ncbi:hypothetical protein KIN20_028265 [Parelaphostrongylus tenuis]|uniref:Rab3-GAP regulatory subunit N-terminal domain-containing protein n=1 Tax=Parelaphostrongylus tenuis TaxID=148309 RepID=A0AAD5R0I5_PARTN|nr:hypothetical protein KIN20_028265 [Parelaphostrongylus tenuis]
MDYVLLVNLQRLVLLARSTADETQLEIRILKELDGQLQFAEQDYITCGCLFGLGTHRISESLDCLIVALGMSNGHLVFLTEKGQKHELRHVLFTGVHRQCAFEQYVTASMASFNETISSTTPPPYFTYMYTSDRVFSTFAWTTENDRRRIWTEAVKYGKSFVPHFGIRDMLGITSTPRKKTVLSQNAHKIVTRGTLGDSRLAVGVALEVTRGLVAVVDHIARVLLIDIQNRQIVRIWKGYRDASVAWVTSTNGNQTALFLSIFAPRRALLEVWNVQSGVRVGALNVDAGGVLLDGGLAPILCDSQNNRYERNAFFVDSESVGGTFPSINVVSNLSGTA